MKACTRFIIIVSMIFLSNHAFTQIETKHIKIAVFAPIYLDSAFDGDQYKAGLNTLPKTILPGLDFYNGVMLAIDSLQQEGNSIEVLIYDTKSENIQSIVQKNELKDISLIIASLNNHSEIKPLADLAFQLKIPLISSTFPNDGGIRNNPYFVVINSTLRTHCEELYKYLQKYYATGNLVMFRRKGMVEDLIQSAFIDAKKNTVSLPLKIKTIELSDTFNTRNVLDALDSNKKNIVICATINEAYAVRLVKTLSSATNYISVAVGMPTWDGIKDLDKPDCKGVDIIYSSPYNFSKSDKSYIAITNAYKNKLAGRPSDMAFKGYESMYHFTKLLLMHEHNLINFLSEKSFKVFNDFDISASKNRITKNTDYLENRKLYFIKKTDGVIKSVN
jgi:hypothetical protein